MKKNKAMRAAGVLMVVTLLTTSIVSGTYAKYVTKDSASDTARVAKFGVVVEANGKLFSDTYKTASNTPGESGDSTAAATLSVVSSGVTGTTTDHDGVNGTDKVVAPGTKNDKGLTFSVTGKPEVAVKIGVVVTASNGTDDPKDIFLGAKTGLPDMTTGDTTDTFNNSAAYYPIKYTLTQTKGGTTTTLVDKKKLSELETALENLSASTVKANTDLAGADGIGTLKLTWEWDFESSGAGTYDKQDTLLGDLAAGTTLMPSVALTDGTDYSLNTDVNIAITVTQVD